MVIIAITRGIIIPQNAMNFVKSYVFLKASNQTIKTKVFTNNCMIAAIKFKPLKISVKFAIRKKEIPSKPERSILVF